jgi:site-specific recombinase XerD
MPNNPQKQSLIDQDDYHTLKDIPPESDWINERRTRSKRTADAYQFDVNEFKKFLGIKKPEDYRKVSRRHVTEWINHLKDQKLTNESIARKISAISSLFKFYCEQSALRDNPCKNITRPQVHSNIGKSDIISDSEAKKFLDAPPSFSIRGLRDRAILAVFCYQALRRSEVRDLKVKSIHNKDGVPHLLVKGKGEKTRDLPLHPVAMQRIYAYLEADKRKDDLDEPLFCSLKKYKDADGLLKHMSTDAIYDIVMFYARAAGVKVENFHPHCLRATGATNALSNGADLGKVQDFLGHANIQTTRIYDKRKDDIADSPTFKIKY